MTPAREGAYAQTIVTDTATASDTPYPHEKHQRRPKAHLPEPRPSRP